MFGLNSCQGSFPHPANQWWATPPGHPGSPVCLHHTTNQWGVPPLCHAPPVPGPTTHVHFWGDHTAQYMHQALANQQLQQPLPSTAYPFQRQMLQDQHGTAPQQAQVQTAEHSALLQCIAQLETAAKTQNEEAMHRMAQLEAAVKAQQLGASQGTADMRQYVTEQMAQWRAWKESEEPQPSIHRQPEASQAPPHAGSSELALHEETLQDTRRPQRRPTQPATPTLPTKDYPAIEQRLTSLESQLTKQIDKGMKRAQSQDDHRPAKRITRSGRAYSDPLEIFDSTQDNPRLTQKNKAQPSRPPWRATTTASSSYRRPEARSIEMAKPSRAPTGFEIELIDPTPPVDHVDIGQLPPLADFDGKAINHEYPPFDAHPAWEVEQSQIGADGYRRHAVWRRLWRDKLPQATQLRMARNPFSTHWCDQWFNHLQDLEWERPQAQGKKLNRCTAWFVKNSCTCTYDYGSMQIYPRAFPEWLYDLMDVVMPECGLADKQAWPDSCNVNFYERHDDLVGPHADNEALFQGKHQEVTIISLSLGGTRQLLVHAAKQVLGSITLRNGDLMAMEKWTQAHLRHSIAKLPQDAQENPKRVNLTWRWIAQHKLNCALASLHTIKVPATLPVPDKAVAADEAEHGWSVKSE